MPDKNDEQETIDMSSVAAARLAKQYRASLMRRVFALGKEIHGATCITPDDLKQAIREDILRMKIAKPRAGADGGIELIRHMEPYQLKELIYEYDLSLGRRPYHKPDGRGRNDPSAPITPRQNRFITDLFNELNCDARRRTAYIQHALGRKSFWPQTRGEANKVIEALKKIKEHRENKTCPEE